MKKIVLNYLVIAALAVAGVFSSCKKDDDGNLVSGGFNGIIMATVENGNAYDSKIENVVVWPKGTESQATPGIMAKYVNGEFTVELHATVDDNFLKEIYGSYPALKVSNKNVKGTSLNISAFQSGVSVGNFYYAKNSGIQTEALFVYVDGNVNITGSDSQTIINRDSYGNILGEHTYKISYGVSLKKGWNVMYFTETHSNSGQKTTTSETVTTNAPEGMRWYFNGPGERIFQPKSICPIFPPTVEKLIRVTYTH